LTFDFKLLLYSLAKWIYSICSSYRRGIISSLIVIDVGAGSSGTNSNAREAGYAVSLGFSSFFGPSGTNSNPKEPTGSFTLTSLGGSGTNEKPRELSSDFNVGLFL